MWGLALGSCQAGEILAHGCQGSSPPVPFADSLPAYNLDVTGHIPTHLIDPTRYSMWIPPLVAS